MIKFVLNRGLSRPLFYSRVPAMEHLQWKTIIIFFMSVLFKVSA